MSLRPPVFAGAFYSANPEELAASVDAWLQAGLKPAAAAVEDGREPSAANPGVNPGAAMIMLPHAGHVYCGRVIGATLARVRPFERVVILCPNHSGQGAPLAVWAEGAWDTPLGRVPVDEELARALLEQDAGYKADERAHAREHAVEVLLPFVRRHSPAARIVPVVVSVRPDLLQRAGEGLAAVLRLAGDTGRPAMVIVSSDMHHFGSEADTLRLDARALAPLLALDPAGLYNTVARERISMCGVQPATLALFAGEKLGIARAGLVAHTTSAEASGDRGRVVGYAGVVMD
jgi:AmmeMemoRadiSam system protein B